MLGWVVLHCCIVVTGGGCDIKHVFFVMITKEEECAKRRTRLHCIDSVVLYCVVLLYCSVMKGCSIKHVLVMIRKEE